MTLLVLYIAPRTRHGRTLVAGADRLCRLIVAVCTLLSQNKDERGGGRYGVNCFQNKRRTRVVGKKIHLILEHNIIIKQIMTGT